jgi:hypothetical protein
MTQALARRPRKRLNPVDVSAFTYQVDQAMEAFQHDVSYAVEMARSAVNIVRKREVWQSRRAARQADATTQR